MDILKLNKLKKDLSDIYATLSEITTKASESKYFVATFNKIEEDVKMLNEEIKRLELKVESSVENE